MGFQTSDGDTSGRYNTFSKYIQIVKTEVCIDVRIERVELWRLGHVSENAEIAAGMLVSTAHSWPECDARS